MISKAGIIYGMGDALNARAFLLTYCKQKGYPTERIKIYTDRFWYLFEKEGFKRELNRVNHRGLIGYHNFCNYDLPKIYKTDKCDECIARNAGIDFSFDTIVPLNWNTKLNFDLPRKFVTVNYGSGEDLKVGEKCIKTWDIKYWEKLVMSIGVPVVQIGGGSTVKTIKGCTLNLENKLSIFQSAEVMKRALFHIDIEGGLPILNQHLGGRSVVLFGACAIENQGRSFNLNLRSNTCTPCYEWGTHKHTRLKYKISEIGCGMECMRDLKPEYVIEQIYKKGWLI